MWIYIPSLCAPDMAVSRSDSLPLANLSDGKAELPLTWNGKPMRLRSLRAAWKRAPWMRRLSGLISSPSTLQHGAEQWIASLRDSHASRTAMPASAKAPTTSAGYGLTSDALFASLEHGSWCSKTSQVCLVPADSTTYSATWPKTGSMRNGWCYLRQPLALLTDASECSSWLTPHGFGAGNGPDGNEFSTAVRAWTTPQSQDSKESARSESEFASLTVDAMRWPTPSASVSNDGESLASWEDRRDRMKAMEINGNGLGMPLAIAARAWPTPSATDGKGSPIGGGLDMRRNMTRGVRLPEQVERYLHQDQPTNDGQTSSPQPRGSRRRLNPAFVCWLMGLPPLWTNIAHTSCDAAAMALYRSKLQRQLSSFFGGSESRVETPADAA